MAVVKQSSIEDNPDDDTIETEIPKVYLKVQTLIEFDTFVATHGPFTPIDSTSDPEHTDSGSLKRKGGVRPEHPARRAKQPAYFIAELAHVVAMCDERLPYVGLANELTKRAIFHQGLQVEANATGLVLRLVQLPPPTAEVGVGGAWHALLKRLLSVSIRVLSKGVMKSWMTEFVFYATPLASTHPKEQGSRRPVYFQYDMATVDATSRTVDALLSDWGQIVHLYTLVHDLSEYLKIDKYNLSNMFSIKSYNYSKLVLCYGPDKGAMVSINWNSTEKAFKLAFGAANSTLNAHSLIKEQLESHLNEHRNLAQIIQLLYETYEPLISISKLPTLPQLGIQNTRPQVPVQTFTIMAQSCTLIRLAYQGMYCLELRIRGAGLVSLRDGAYSRFDRSNVVDVFTPTQGLKAFLSKYVDETAVFRRRSQSEDDNPPSPVSVEVEGGGFLGHHRGPQSPAGTREPGLRFHPPLTPPSGSNPHTPASPHTSSMNQPNTHTSFGSSPATSFNLSSPTSLPTNINPSPMPHPSPGGLVANSPLNPQLPSPGGLLSNSSPGPVSTSLPGHSPVSSFMATGHTDGSPFPSSQGLASPAASNWPGSPSMPRPSPARPGQSPGGHPIMHSPQSDLKTGGHLSRVLPQRSWAGAVPTLLTHEALETLCCASMHPQGLPGPELAPLERFLGCVYMRRQLQRFIHNESYLTAIPNTEPGVIHFKVAEVLQCRIGLNPQHLQSLHLKITPLSDNKDVWTSEELQVLEKFFDTRTATPPYKPTSMFTFCTMLNVPCNVLKDFIQIMKLELMPGLVQQQGMKWSVQWMLRIPPSAQPIVPTGMSGVLVYRTKILFFLQITRMGVQYPSNMEPPSLILPFIYDINTNLTQLAEKRETGSVPGMAAASQLLKHFTQFQSNITECSIFPALRDLLLNLVLPSEPQQPSPAPGAVQQIQSPAMQGGQPGYPVSMPMGMMGPQ
ncbi:hypothetical protein Zmor_027675 [Zophobas morio]|uniref:Mediator of RNA polymerase II transcription subunit 14 n=2 Tax=Zophobas morio TaxID=2755281 RepID=A0AA38HP86_9CUCU|nr:hypothetical protein Zmor_027675 [Zophobas morio]